MEMTALTGGTLLKILKGAGETAALGEAIAITGNKDEDISALLSEVVVKRSAKAAACKDRRSACSSDDGRKAAPSNSWKKRRTTRLHRAAGSPTAAPARRTMAAGTSDCFADRGPHGGGKWHRSQSRSPASGPNGRIIKRDIETALSGRRHRGCGTQPPTFVPSTVVGASRVSETKPLRRCVGLLPAAWRNRSVRSRRFISPSRSRWTMPRAAERRSMRPVQRRRKDQCQRHYC